MLHGWVSCQLSTPVLMRRCGKITDSCAQMISRDKLIKDLARLFSHRLLGKHWLIDYTSESLPCAVLAPFPILLICLSCCVPCASCFISFAELISVSLGWLWTMSAAATLRNESHSRLNLEHFSRKFNRDLFGSIHRSRVINAEAIQ